MKNRKLLMSTILIVTLLSLSSCSPTINYMGKSYAPTQNVDIFFEEADIKQEYTVMGRMNNEAGDFEIDDAEDVQEAMVAKAKAVGADAILFIGFYTDKINGENSSEHLSEDGRSVYGNTSTNRSKQYTVKLLRYNK